MIPLVGTNGTTSQYRAVEFELLPRDLKTKLIKPTKRGQVRASEGDVGHVEVSRMDGVITFILGRPRPLDRERRASLDYTLNCEEPLRI